MKIILMFLLMTQFFFSVSVHALPAPEDAESRIATRKNVLNASRDRGFKGPYASIRTIREAFDVPISFEWSFVKGDRSEVDRGDWIFSVKEGETLKESLDRFCAEMSGQLQWGRIQGIICVWPVASAGITESTLDTTVRLDLSGVSTWHAILEVCREVNIQTEDRVLVPRVEPSQDRYIPPAALRNHDSISLSFAGVTAREAVCAVLAASPLHIEFNYGNYYRPESANPRPPSSSLSLTAFDESRNLLYDVAESPLSEEARQWHNEAQSTVPIEKADAIRPKTQP